MPLAPIHGHDHCDDPKVPQETGDSEVPATINDKAILDICRSTVGSLVAACIVVICPSAAQSRGISPFEFLQPTGQTLDEYYPLRKAESGVIFSLRDGRPMSKWRTEPTGSDTVDVIWEDPRSPNKPERIEEWAVKRNCAGGANFVWLNAYRNEALANGVSVRFAIRTTKAEIKVNDEGWFDITSGGSCGTDGQPYALFDAVSAPYSLRVWGEIIRPNGATVGRRFFWQHTVSLERLSHSPCLHGKDAEERPALKRSEAWWDTSHGWTLGSSGSTGANGEPDGQVVNYGRWGLVAKDRGWGWVVGGGRNNLAYGCMMD